MSEGKVHSRLGYRDEDGTFHLATVTEEEMEEARAEAAKVTSANLSFADMSPAALTALSAEYHAPLCLEGYEAAVEQFGADSPEAATAKRLLAVAYRDAGKHAEAFSLVPDDPKFQAGAEAIERPDDGDGAWCECEPFGILETTGGERRWKSLYSDVPVWVPAKGGAVTRWTCKKCKWTNITAGTVPPQDEPYYEQHQQDAARRLRANLAQVFGRRGK